MTVDPADMQGPHNAAGVFGPVKAPCMIVVFSAAPDAPSCDCGRPDCAGGKAVDVQSVGVGMERRDAIPALRELANVWEREAKAGLN